MLLLSQLSPLPIYEVGHDVDTSEQATGQFGCVFPHIDHRMLDEPGTARGCPVGSADQSRRLANVFTELEARFWKKVNAMADRVLVYQRPNTTSTSKEFIPTHNDPSNLSFNSWFESGNLECAYRVHNRNYATYLPQCTKHLNQSKLAAPKACRGGLAPPTEVLLPAVVDQEYDLYCDCDTYTFVKLRDLIPPGKTSLVVRFNIRNMMKRDSLYNSGMLPTVYSEAKAAQGLAGWTHAGVEAYYYQNSDEFDHPRRRWRTKRYHYTLSFVYQFDTGVDTVYFAHCFPYTYTNLQSYLKSLLACPLRSPNVRRRTLCPTVCGNACDVLTITEYTNEPRAMFDVVVLMLRTGVVLTARVHPGETNGSFVMQGIIDFLTGSSKEAQRLRQCFVFKIIPMLNPDGVIHGNYRCSVAGVDLNRRWSKPCQDTHPTIFAAKHMIMSMRNARRVVLFCDIHGHSRKKNMFVFPDCTFNVARSKRSTGRVTVWNDIRILNSFTLETSFCGSGENQVKYHPPTSPSSRGGGSSRTEAATMSTTHYRVRDLVQSGEKFCCALANYGRLLAIEPVDEASVPPLPVDPDAAAGGPMDVMADDDGDDTCHSTPLHPRNRHRQNKDDNDDNTFELSADAILLLDEISTVVPLSAETDCNSSEGSAGSDSNPSEDNKDDDEIQADTRWQALLRHRARSRIVRRSPRLIVDKDMSPKNVLKALPRSPPRPTTVPVANPTPSEETDLTPMRPTPAATGLPVVTKDPLAAPHPRRLSLWTGVQGVCDLK
ncbi:hypothetical protein DYB28_004389 [Aphanomyces astaci]|uniref:Peptidase M14 domain-containing protein n=1 Tax=Aphanomyces astaci TaxID=112090 RepID=A0A9X8E5U5_APHAT|nr:hypothetical protein DYB28_004389 [Aphanomyces astaci]